jgi:hypothetical protein
MAVSFRLRVVLAQLFVLAGPFLFCVFSSRLKPSLASQLGLAATGAAA